MLSKTKVRLCDFCTQISPKYWQCSEQATPKYSKLAYEICKAEGVWENGRSKTFTLTFPHTSLLKQLIRPSGEVPSLYQANEQLIAKTEDHPGTPKEQAPTRAGIYFSSLFPTARSEPSSNRTSAVNLPEWMNEWMEVCSVATLAYGASGVGVLGEVCCLRVCKTQNWSPPRWLCLRLWPSLPVPFRGVSWDLLGHLLISHRVPQATDLVKGNSFLKWKGSDSWFFASQEVPAMMLL